MTTAICEPMDPRLVAELEQIFLVAWRRELQKAVDQIQKVTPGKPPKAPQGKSRRNAAQALAERDGARCAYCAEPFVELDGVATLDHVLPRCLVRTNARKNLVLACEPCNTAKGHEIPDVLKPITAALVYTLHRIYGQGAGQ